MSTDTSGQHKNDTADVHPPNIIIFGETGVGKSSIINLIAGQELAHTSSDALGCTFQHRQYNVELDGTLCSLWDTTGLDEGTEGTIPASEAERNLKSLIQALANAGGIHLVVYCIRGFRHTKALQHNYELFYVTVCRKKVPVALVVTGLEHQPGEMETWWTANEAVLRQYGMHFDAHACVTALNVADPVIQQRRSESQRLLRELVVRYSTFPAWKADPSFMSLISPAFRTVLRRTMSGGKGKKNTAARKVIFCDMAPTSSSSIPLPSSHATKTHAEWLEDQQYEFVHVDKHVLQAHATSKTQQPWTRDAGILVFYTSSLGNGVIPQEDLNVLDLFYKTAGGQTCPVIIVLRGHDDEERTIQECRNALSNKNIQAYPTTLSDEKLNEMISRLFVEHIEIKDHPISRVCSSAKQWLTTAVGAIMASRRWRQGQGHA